MVSPVLLELCFGSSMVTGEWVAGARSLTADVLVSRISCGFPMRGVGFLVQKEEEDGGVDGLEHDEDDRRAVLAARKLCVPLCPGRGWTGFPFTGALF